MHRKRYRYVVPEDNATSISWPEPMEYQALITPFFGVGGSVLDFSAEPFALYSSNPTVETLEMEVPVTEIVAAIVAVVVLMVFLGWSNVSSE